MSLLMGNLLAGIAILGIGLPLISRTMIYPRINSNTLPGMIIFGLIMAAAAGWVGAQLGAWLSTCGQSALDQPTTESPRMQLVRH